MKDKKSVVEFKASFNLRSYTVAKQYLHFAVSAIRACTELYVLWSLGGEACGMGWKGGGGGGRGC